MKQRWNLAKQKAKAAEEGRLDGKWKEHMDWHRNHKPYAVHGEVIDRTEPARESLEWPLNAHCC